MCACWAQRQLLRELLKGPILGFRPRAQDLSIVSLALLLFCVRHRLKRCSVAAAVGARLGVLRCSTKPHLLGLGIGLGRGVLRSSLDAWQLNQCAGWRSALLFVACSVCVVVSAEGTAGMVWRSCKSLHSILLLVAPSPVLAVRFCRAWSPWV